MREVSLGSYSSFKRSRVSHRLQPTRRSSDCRWTTDDFQRAQHFFRQSCNERKVFRRRTNSYHTVRFSFWINTPFCVQRVASSTPFFPPRHAFRSFYTPATASNSFASYIIMPSVITLDQQTSKRFSSSVF